MQRLDVGWSDNPCILVTGGNRTKLKKSARRIVKQTGYPAWHIGPRDFDIEISETIKDLLENESERKLLIFEGNTHQFSRDTGNEILSNFFWYPNLHQTRTVLLILVESVTQDHFYRPISTSRYHLDVRNGRDVYDTHENVLVTPPHRKLSES